MQLLPKMTVPWHSFRVSPSPRTLHRAVQVSTKLPCNRPSSHRHSYTVTAHRFLKTPFTRWPAASLNRSCNQSYGRWHKVLRIQSFSLVLSGCKTSSFWHMTGIYDCKCSTHLSARLRQYLLSVSLHTDNHHGKWNLSLCTLNALYSFLLYLYKITPSIFFKLYIYKGF